MSFTNIILAITVLLTGLIAGLFYSWSCSVMPGFAKVSDLYFLTCMQSMNKGIQNPVFFMSFMGTLVVLPLSAYLNYSNPFSIRFVLLAAATAVYLVAVFCVTMFGNVPLNNQLDALDIAKMFDVELREFRQSFEAPWNRLNSVRTVSSFLSFLLVIIALLINRGTASSLK